MREKCATSCNCVGFLSSNGVYYSSTDSCFLAVALGSAHTVTTLLQQCCPALTFAKMCVIYAKKSLHLRKKEEEKPRVTVLYGNVEITITLTYIDRLTYI